MADLVVHGMPLAVVLSQVAHDAARESDVPAEPLHLDLTLVLQGWIENQAAEPTRAKFHWNEYDRMAEHVHAALGGRLVSVSPNEHYLGDTPLNRADLESAIHRVLVQAAFHPRKADFVAVDNQLIREVVSAIARKYHVVRRGAPPGADATAPGCKVVSGPLILEISDASAWCTYDALFVTASQAWLAKDAIRSKLGRDAKDPEDGAFWRGFKAWAKARGGELKDHRRRGAGRERVPGVRGIRLR
jgi:hypothetical protein